MRKDNGKTGRDGEDAGCRYLTDMGCTVIGRNWRSGHLELDIIALCDGELHFVEVKSRTAPLAARPEDNVNAEKRKRIVSAAKAYLRSEDGRKLRDREVFFDVISVVFNGEDTQIDYYPKAFIPIYV